MSRTDKDLPFWLLSEYWEPNHWRCQHSWVRRGECECDLPAEPVRRRPVDGSWRTKYDGCSWFPCWDHYRSAYGPVGCPRWYVRLEFRGPERRRVRDECRAAVQEYRGTGEVDTIPSTTQHRHAARWDYW